MTTDPFKQIRRLGRWRVAADMLRDPRADSALQAVQSSVIIMEATYDAMTNSVEYVGRSPVFRIVGEGMEAPYYEPVFDNGHTLQWRACSPGEPVVALRRA